MPANPNEEQVRRAVITTLGEWRSRLDLEEGDTGASGLIKAISDDIVDYLFHPEEIDDDLAQLRREAEGL